MNNDDEYRVLKDILRANERMVIDKHNSDYNQANIDRIYTELSFYLATLEDDMKNETNPSKKTDITNLIEEVENLQKKFGAHVSNKVLGMPDTGNETRNLERERERELRDVFGDELDNTNDSLEGGRKRRKKSRRYKRRKSRRCKTRRCKTRKRRSRK
jgi:hypothetical protein